MITDTLCLTLVVRDQDEALAFYTGKLGFEKRADYPIGAGQRWLTVAPPASHVVFVLQPPDWFQGEEQARLRAQIGLTPTLIFAVDDCRQTYEHLLAQGVEILAPPANLGFGLQATCKDLYGNRLVFVEDQRQR